MKRHLLLAMLLLAYSPAHAMDNAQEIKPSSTREIKAYEAQEVKPHVAEEIKPYQGQEVHPSAVSPGKAEIAVTAPPAKQAPPQKKASRIQGVIGLWQTSVTGSANSIPDDAGNEIVHVSTGAAAGLLRIKSNGTYSWNSYGGKKGKWVRSGNPEYAIELIDNYESRRWKVKYDASKKALVLWSGNIWYEGRKADLKQK